jgi:dipeptidyl aminopeptidase/acylaminoacyl peptidase
MHGIRDGQSGVHLPYQDMMAGVDLLVQRGIADAKRLGVYGHSYGGYLTAYAITQTERFNAAVVHEGSVGLTVEISLFAAPGTDAALMMEELRGVKNPFEPAERERLIAESVLLQANRIKTPTLLLFGTTKAGRRALAEDCGWPLFQVLQRFRVPSELVLYDEGHGFFRPSNVADSTTRMINWMDRWVLGGAR